LCVVVVVDDVVDIVQFCVLTRVSRNLFKARHKGRVGFVQGIFGLFVCCCLILVVVVVVVVV
jgi:hypothetical protein